MSLYFAFIYGLLVLELGIFSIMILPVPNFLMSSKKHFIRAVNFVIQGNETLKMVSKCVVIFITIFFLDCVNKLKKLQTAITVFSTAKISQGFNTPMGHQHLNNMDGLVDGVSNEYMNLSKNELYKNKFYSQRNLYLTGFTLFLSLAILRISSIIMDLVNVKESLNKHLMVKDSIINKEDLLKTQKQNNEKVKSDIEEMDKLIKELKEKGIASDN